MAKSIRTQKAAAARQESRQEVREPSYSDYNMGNSRRYYDGADSPYSLQSMLRFLNNNAGLIFLALALYIVGFLSGAMWTENRMLKDGYTKGGSNALVQNQVPTGQAAPEAPPAPLNDDDWKTVQENPAGVIGEKNAKVTMVEFTDYQCPFCSRHYTETYKALYDKYVKSGQLKIVFKDQALPFHPNASVAAQAARCAGEQNKFEAMHDALFANQNDWANLGNDAAIAKFGEYAATAGMNGERLVQCVKDGKFEQAVTDDGTLGTRLGAGATPTFFVNKEVIVGAQPLSVFEAAIENAL